MSFITSSGKKYCGPQVQVVNNDNNGSDIYLVKLTNIGTGQVLTMPMGTTQIVNMSAGAYNVEVYTDSQGLVSLNTPFGGIECLDAYSWNGDSKAYYFNNVNLWCCGCTLTITIDDIEC